MNKAKAYLKSMRLRTLPLSLAGIIVGVAVSVPEFGFRPLLVLSLVFTTIALQVLSNLSNELGDALHGTDSATERQGMHYSIMDGELTITEMKRLIAIVAVLCCVFGTAMIYLAFGTLFSMKSLFFFLLGALAIVAAMRYTLGKNPYGYRGHGDFFVFVFFGLATVCGSYLICSDSFSEPLVFLPAAAIGCFSMGVLNVNNIRDMKTDAATRVTMAIRLGARRARIYQLLLILFGWLFMLVFSILYLQKSSISSAWLLIFVITLPLFVIHLRGVFSRTDKELDPMLPLLVMSTFLLSILFAIGICL